MNEFLILLILKIAPSNIYEIKKFIDNNFAPFLQVSIGVIIPALKRLEAAKAVKCEKSITDGGLRKTTYTLAENSEKLFDEYLSKEIDCAPQLAKREVEILIMLLDTEYKAYSQEAESLQEPLFSENQLLMLKNKIINALTANIKQLEKSAQFTKMNMDFLNLELVYADAKLRHVKEFFAQEEPQFNP